MLDDLFTDVTSYLFPSEKVRAARVCREWYQIAVTQNEHFWAFSEYQLLHSWRALLQDRGKHALDAPNRTASSLCRFVPTFCHPDSEQTAGKGSQRCREIGFFTDNDEEVPYGSPSKLDLPCNKPPSCMRPQLQDQDDEPDVVEILVPMSWFHINQWMGLGRTFAELAAEGQAAGAVVRAEEPADEEDASSSDFTHPLLEVSRRPADGTVWATRGPLPRRRCRLL